ncbi:MAG: hypothetical protein C4326_07640 [Ignavibacteria bacterium]
MLDSPALRRMTKLRLVMVSLFIAAATLMTFVNAVNADFVNWDDDVYVTENPFIQNFSRDTLALIFSKTYYYAWTPLTLLSHAADIALWGMNPRGHHLTNVVLHVLNAVALFWVGLLFFVMVYDAHPSGRSFLDRMSGAVIVGAASAALLFAVHPLRVEPVAWVSGRKDVLCLFFLLPAFGSYLLWRFKDAEGALFATHIFFVLALLSKPTALVFPLVLVLVDAWWLSDRKEKQNMLNLVVEGKLLLFLMSIAVGVITFVAAGRGSVNVVAELNLLERFFLPSYALMFYVWKTVAPIALSPIYPEVPRAFLYFSAVGFVVVTYGCLTAIGKRWTGPALAFFTFVLAVLPVFLGLASGVQPLADRYTYISTVSLFLFVGGCVLWLWRTSAASPAKWYRRGAMVSVLLVVWGLGAYRTIRHTAMWNNSIALWSHAVRYAPQSAEEYAERGSYIKPTYADAFINLGTAYYDAGDRGKAVEQFRRILHLDPCNADAHYNLGTLVYEQGDPEASKQWFDQAIRCDSTYAKAFYNLGILYAKRDSTLQALDMFQRAARLGMVEARRILSARGYGW